MKIISQIHGEIETSIQETLLAALASLRIVAHEEKQTNFDVNAAIETITLAEAWVVKNCKE